MAFGSFILTFEIFAIIHQQFVTDMPGAHIRSLIQIRLCLVESLQFIKKTIPSICKPQELVCNFCLLKMLVLRKCRFREELFSLLANEDFT